MKWIGRGTFGNVYQYSDQTAVKEEFKVRICYMYIYCSNVVVSKYLSGH